MTNRIPKWVNELSSNDENKDILVQIALAGNKSLDTPREVSFVLRGEEQSKDIIKTIEINGWETAHGFDNGYWVEAKKNSYILSKEQLGLDENNFKNIAQQFGWNYDGWYASVE